MRANKYKLFLDQGKSDKEGHWTHSFMKTLNLKSLGTFVEF